MKITLKPQPKRVYFDHNKKENFTVIKDVKYKRIYIDRNILNIDDKQFLIVVKNYNYLFTFKLLKKQINVANISRFAKTLQDDGWNASSPYPFEGLFDNIINNVTPINN